VVGDDAPRRQVHDDQHCEPPDPLAEQRGEGGVPVAGSQGGYGGRSLEVLGNLLLGHVEHVVDGNDTQEHAIGIHHGQGDEVIVLNPPDRLFAVLEGVDAHKGVIHELLHRVVGAGQYEASQAQGVQELPPGIHHVDHMDGFAVLPPLPYVLERLGHRPFRADGNVVGGHEPAHASLRIPQQLQRLEPVVTVEEIQEPLGRPARHLLEELGKIVWVEVGKEFFRLLV